MSSYTIATESIDSATLKRYYDAAKASHGLTTSKDLDVIFSVAAQQMRLFPGIKGVATPEAYMDRWVKGYYDAKSNPPSQRNATPKSSCTDPAIRIIVQTTQGITDSQAAEGEKSHNLFMSAENIQGNLLEEYIAANVRPYGFLWCAGNVLRALDFCNTTGTALIQIKNKSNTENSSSSAIRTGTTIEKWFRLGTKTKNGIKSPDYKWSKLNKIINKYKTEGAGLPPCNMSEEEYNAFLVKAAKANLGLITNE